MVTKLALDEIGEGAILLDGFPRSVTQAEALADHTDIDAVIDLNVPFDVIKVKCYKWLHRFLIGSLRIV